MMLGGEMITVKEIPRIFELLKACTCAQPNLLACTLLCNTDPLALIV
jgi:hypothetical protein